jgi:hypothetical protein
MNLIKHTCERSSFRALIICFACYLLPPSISGAESTIALKLGQESSANVLNANSSLIKCTVVRAYPDDVDPLKVHEHTYQIGDDINLDVRGLGDWFQGLLNLGVSGKTITGILGKGVPETLTEDNYALWIREVQSATKTLCLYIDGHPFNDLTPVDVTPQWNQSNEYDQTKCPLMTLTFRLVRNSDNSADSDAFKSSYENWNTITTALYGQMRGGFWAFNPDGVKTDFTAGIPDSQGIGVYFVSSALNPDDSDKTADSYVTRLLPYSAPWMFGSLLGVGVITLICFYLGITTDLLRDTTTTANPGGRYPFSLGLCQMAFWTIVIIGCYLFIWCSSSNYNTFNSTALLLLGISSATGLSASLINKANPTRPVSSKLTPAELDLTNHHQLDDLLKMEIEDLGKLPAQSPLIITATDRIDEIKYRIKYLKNRNFRFWLDMLSEQNYVSFHRFQLVVWTFLLAIVFVWAVWAKLDMPTFDASILILMGISSGSYIGFKWPNS